MENSLNNIVTIAIKKTEISHSGFCRVNLCIWQTQKNWLNIVSPFQMFSLEASQKFQLIFDICIMWPLVQD